MDTDNMTLARGDAALILHANGDIGLLLPKSAKDDDDAPQNVALAMAFGIIAQHPVLSQIALTMAEASADEDAREREEATQ